MSSLLYLKEGECWVIPSEEFTCKTLWVKWNNATVVILRSGGALFILLILLVLEVKRKSWGKEKALLYLVTAPTAACFRQFETDTVCCLQRSSGVFCLVLKLLLNSTVLMQCCSLPLLWGRACAVSSSSWTAMSEAPPNFTVDKVKPCPQSQVLT